MPSVPTTEITTSPVYNALNSLTLLSQAEHMPALDMWVLQTAAALSEAERYELALVVGPLRGALLGMGEQSSFPAYLDALAAQPAETMRDRALLWLAANRTFVEVTLVDGALALTEQPQALRDFVVRLLRTIWTNYLEAEWQRVANQLEGPIRPMTAALHAESPNQPPIEAHLRELVGGEVWAKPAVIAAQIERVVYVNSPHVGRYVSWLVDGTVLYLFFHALRALPTVMRTAPIGATELVNRMTALADENRTQILALFAQQDMLTAQDIMTQLDLSQSNVSRQLRALAPYVHEVRSKGANKQYYFSPTSYALTIQAAARVPHGEAAPTFQDLRLGFPEPLRRYINVHGKLTMFPTRPKDQRAVLELIASGITANRDYSEKEINALIQSQIAFDDFVTIRRELCNYHFVEREPNGSRYWRGSVA